MIKKIFAIADIHIPNSEEKRPYSEMLKQAIAEIYKAAKDLQKDEFRIIIAGDIFHNKIRISNEASDTFHMMLNYLNAIGKTYIIAGNHDMLENNLDRLDSISPTFGIKDVYPNIVYLDRELDYHSGCYVDDNVTFALYSIFEGFKRPSDLDDTIEDSEDLDDLEDFDTDKEDTDNDLNDDEEVDTLNYTQKGITATNSSFDFNSYFG